MIYMINAFDEPTVIPRLCEAFLKLFDAYASSLKGGQLQGSNDVILQIVPLSFIASSETLVLPDPTMYKKLAFEVYDRCAPSLKLDRTGLTQFSCASAVQLAKKIPRNINLKLTSNLIDGPPLADRCVHVSYCYSIHSQWLTASWVDSHGCSQWNASYHLAMDLDEVWPHFPEVAQDIWETTLEFARLHSAPYRVFVVKNESIAQEECDGTLKDVGVRQNADNT